MFTPDGLNADEAASAASDIEQAVASDNPEEVKKWIWIGAPAKFFVQSRYLQTYQKTKLDQKLILDSAAGDVSAVNQDLQQGADVNVNPVQDEWRPPLTWAASCNLYDVVDDLLENGADPNLSGALVGTVGIERNYTPFLAAAAGSDEKVVRLMLKYGADPNTQTSALRLDARFQTIDPAYPHLKITRHSATTALIQAVGRPANVADLLAAGAKPNVTEQDGRTALFWAAERGDMESALLLPRYGTDPALTDDEGETPARLAQEGGNARLAQIIEAAIKKE